jgi:hypothetical protein
MVAVGNSREPRSDAAHNHQALVRAAIAAVRRHGPHVPMAKIAADATVQEGCQATSEIRGPRLRCT